MARLLQPQEIEVFYIIPTLKRYLTIYFKKTGLKQNKIAELLQIEGATVSQYLNEKRGFKIRFGSEVIKEIENSSILIYDKISLLREMQRLIKIIRENGTLCEIHKRFSDIPKDCNLNVVNCM